jgi:hypothetical protein
MAYELGDPRMLAASWCILQHVPCVERRCPVALVYLVAGQYEQHPDSYPRPRPRRHSSSLM